MPGYEARLTPTAGAPRPSVTPEDYGAGVADAVGGLARQVHRQKIEEYTVDRRLRENAEWTDFQVRFANEREAQGASARESRKSDEPGHAARMAREWQDREEKLLAGLASDKVRKQASASLGNWASAWRSNEADWETVRTGERNATAYRDQLNASANRTRRLEEVGDYGLELKVQREVVNGLDVPGELREKLWTETEQTMAVAFLQGRIDADPPGAMALIDSGSFDEVLTPAQVDALKNGAAVEIRRAEAEAERLAAADASALNQDMRTFRQETGQGLDRSAEIAGLRQRAIAAGREDIVAELDGAEADTGFARAYEGAPPAQLEQRLAVLNGKDKPTDAEARERKWIEGKLPGISTRYTEDPVGFYAREGGQGAPPPLDMADPASIAARSKWARSFGVREVLSKTEAAEWRKAYDSGRAGEEQVMELLHRFPADQAMAAARLVDPADSTLPVLATLPAEYRAIARRGREALKADKKLLSDPVRESADLEEAVGRVEARFEQALRTVAPDMRAGILRTARQITAGYADKAGGTYNAESYHKAINMALGATTRNGVQYGGLGRWNDDWFLLPAGMSGRQFGDQARAAAAAAETRPVNPDGSPANIGRGVYPVAVAGGWYEFRTRGGRVLRGSDGAPWRIRPEVR